MYRIGCTLDCLFVLRSSGMSAFDISFVVITLVLARSLDLFRSGLQNSSALWTLLLALSLAEGACSMTS
jgi:hypothetical protein